MRGNGLSADTYVAVADVDPRTADFLLAELGARGVAAYAADSPEPGTSGRVDRLYVDATAELQARTMVDEQLSSAAAGPAPVRPEDGADPGDGIDFDAAFADIVAGFHQPGGSVGRWSAEEDLAAGPTSGPVFGPDPAAGPGTGVPTATGPVSNIGWDDVLRPEPAPGQESAAPTDSHDRYVPPPPPPLPRGSRRTIAAWLAVTGGPAVLFAAAIFGWPLPDFVLLSAVVAFLAGFVTLVAGLRDGSEQQDGDDGAVL